MILADRLRMKMVNLLPPAFVAAATSGSDTAGSGTLVITNPTAIDGDLILMGITGRNLTSVTTLAGWTNILTSQIGSGQYLYLYSKVAASLPASETWTLGDRRCSVFTASFRHAAVDVIGGVTGDIDMFSFTASSITATGSGLLLLIAQVDATGSFTPPSDMTERVDYTDSPSNTVNTITLATVDITAGSTGAKTGASSSDNSGQSLLISLIAA